VFLVFEFSNQGVLGIPAPHFQIWTKGIRLDFWDQFGEPTKAIENCAGLRWIKRSDKVQ
jgi:hypothetical protein